MNPYAALLIGIALAAAGGDAFVRGIRGLADAWRVPSVLVASTLAAVATSAPELAVGINSALAGVPQIAVGDSLGSNVVNLGLILGACLVIGEMRVAREATQRAFATAALAPVATAALLAHGGLDRLHAAALMALFLAYLASSLLEARRHRAATKPSARTAAASIVTMLLLGLAAMVGGGYLIVDGAAALAVRWGIDGFVIGAAIVAFGTSTPELAVMIVARLRGHGEISLATLLGSNVFNGLFIVPTVVLIRPAVLTLDELLPALAFGLIVVALCYPGRDGRLARWRGLLLIAAYVGFIIAITPASVAS